MDQAKSTQSKIDDLRTIASFKAGDVAVFREIYLTYFDKLCTYASTFVPHEEASDLVQDVFWRVWNTREQLTVSGVTELQLYLTRSVRNRALDSIRHRQMRDANIGKLTDIVEEQLINAYEESSTFQESSLQESFLLDRVERVINDLPARSREILMLRWYQGIALEDIPGIMAISYGSARVLYTRALAMVRERLGVL